jgi:hypothetical protein
MKCKNCGEPIFPHRGEGVHWTHGEINGWYRCWNYRAGETVDHREIGPIAEPADESHIIDKVLSKYLNQ